MLHELNRLHSFLPYLKKEQDNKKTKREEEIALKNFIIQANHLMANFIELEQTKRATESEEDEDGTLILSKPKRQETNLDLLQEQLQNLLEEKSKFYRTLSYCLKSNEKKAAIATTVIISILMLCLFACFYAAIGFYPTLGAGTAIKATLVINPILSVLAGKVAYRATERLINYRRFTFFNDLADIISGKQKIKYDIPVCFSEKIKGKSDEVLLNDSENSDDEVLIVST